MPPERVRAFAPGRVCVIGEHTDYNDGLALALAIAQGVTVQAHRLEPGADGVGRVRAHALDLDEHDEFALADPAPAPGWRAFVRGTVAELARAGLRPVGASLAIQGDVPRGAGMSSSAALEIALALALLALAGTAGEIARTDLARLRLARGERMGGRAHRPARPADLAVRGARAGGAHRLPDARRRRPRRWSWTAGVWSRSIRASGARTRAPVTTSGARNARGPASYWTCARCAKRARTEVAHLPLPLRRRARHVLSDNARVDGAVAALRAGDLLGLARLLNESHASLRDDMEISTPTVEATVGRMLDAGAAGARLLGGGFGGSVLGLLPRTS